MRRVVARKPVEVFNLAFLDIISCAFGAVVMLVLLSKQADYDSTADTDLSAIQQLLNGLESARRSVANLQAEETNQQQNLATAITQQTLLDQQFADVQRQAAGSTARLQQLTEQAASLRQQISQTQAALAIPDPTTDPDEDVGGVPTDADYVLFIIDNSGSMVSIGWEQIVDTVADVIENHPQLKGFNVMAADGQFLSMKPRGWINDTPANRRLALMALKRFTGGDSRPEVGILKAIQTYSKTQGKVSLYVFGDEFTTKDLAGKVQYISKKNWDPIAKRARFRIHGIGFYLRRSQRSSAGFASFMKAIAHHNRGAFIALEVK